MGFWKARVGGWRVKGKEKQVASTREREQISKPNIPREEKKKGESKTTGAQLFSFSFSSFFFFFSGLERVAKHDFYGIVLQSGSVKSSQVKSDKSKESRAREQREREREREAGVVCTCARISVCVL